MIEFITEIILSLVVWSCLRFNKVKYNLFTFFVITVDDSLLKCRQHPANQIQLQITTGITDANKVGRRPYKPRQD